MNHLLRRQWLEMAALALLCLGLLSRPQAAAQGFADGAGCVWAACSRRCPLYGGV